MAGFWKKALAASALLCATALHAGSLDWRLSTANNFDYGFQPTLPAGFGGGEFTLELWIRPNNTFPVGSTSGGSDQLNNWSNANVAPYSSNTWWFAGNFLLDGHNNNNFANGTFSLQFYDGGRVRWLFGDGASDIPTGQLWSVPNNTGNNGPQLLNGQWHHVALVRRFTGGTESTLELWIDGSPIDFETSSARTAMNTAYWNSWSGFPNNQQGWFWGAEKQAAIGVLAQYEDYKGLIDELRFWSRAKSSNELGPSNYANPVTGTENGLVGWYDFNEGSPATSTCSSIVTTQCMSLNNTAANVWNAAEAPTTGGGGDTTAPTVPQNPVATPTSPTTVNLTWSASTDAGGTGVASYRVRRDGANVAGAGAVAGTSYIDAGLTQNTAYSYTVSAVDVAGNRSAESTAAPATTPVAPADLSAPTMPGNFAATATSSTSITLTWTASTDNVGVTRYEVIRDGVPLGFTTGAVVAFVDSGRTPSTTYSYSVYAMDAAMNSSGMATASATTPAAPSSSSGGGGGGGGSFDWATLFAGLALLLWSRAQRRGRFGTARAV
jgi:chitodextrinase